MTGEPEHTPSLQLFAHLAEQLGVRSIPLADFNLSDTDTAASLRHLLIQRYPAQEQSWKCSRIATATAFLRDEDVLPLDGNLAVIPPVSGG